MTAFKKEPKPQLERWQRRASFDIKVVLVSAILTTGLAVWHPAQSAEPQETPQLEARVLSSQEEKAPTAPLNVEEPAPRYDITQEELDLVARVVHAEAVGEGYDGQALVAQCVLNTAEATGMRPDEVVLEPKQYAAPAKEAGDEVMEAVKAVFLDGYEVTAEPVRYFYAPARCESKWHETALEFVLEHGGHRFFKE